MPMPRVLAIIGVCACLLAACGSSGGKKSTSSSTKPGAASGATGAKGAKGRAANKLHKRVGTVTAVGGGTVTLSVKRLGSLHLQTPSTTKVESATAGTATAIAVGDRVLVTQGHDVLVLPRGSAIGRRVDHISKRDLAIRGTRGHKDVAIALSKSSVIDTTSPAAMSDVKTNAVVIVAVRGKGKAASATEIIVLPSGSPFAQ